jgi:hypothetical protein
MKQCLIGMAMLVVALVGRPSALQSAPADPEPIADLIRKLDDDSGDVRAAADKALRGMGAAVAPQVRAALEKNPSAAVKGRLNGILESVFNVKKLVRQLGDDEYSVRQRAKEDLRQAGPAALPALRAAVNDADLEVAQSARTILAELTTPRPAKPEVRVAQLDADGVALAIKQLGDESYEVRMQAKKDLRATGATALPQLKKAADNPDLEVSQSAKLIIDEISKNQK